MYIGEVCGIPYSSQSTITRPANTIQYDAGDVVGGVILFQKAGAANKEILINSLTLMIKVPNIPNGLTSFTLRLYNAEPAQLADNEPYSLAAADVNKYIGKIEIPLIVKEGNALWAQVDGLAMMRKMGFSENLWGYLITNSIYTPTASVEKILTIYNLGV